MTPRFTLFKPTPAINSIPVWEDLGNGAAAWVADFTDQTVTLGAFQVSNWLADDIVNPYNGTYNFLITVSGTVSGGAGNTGQITFHFLDKDQNIIVTGDAINIPNAGLTDYPVSIDGDRPYYVMIRVNNLTGSSNDITAAVTYQPPVTTQVIAEPGGWNGHEIKLERHPEFYSLFEYIFSENKMVFIGDDNEDGNGGIDFILETERLGVDEKISLLIEYAPDDVNFEDYFTGRLQLEGLLELPERELEVPIIPEDKRAIFISRLDTPVDLTSTVDLDGNTVDPVEPVTLNLTSQIIEKKFDGYLLDTRTFDEGDITTSDYVQIDVDTYNLDEIKQKVPMPISTNPEVPFDLFSLEDDGEYHFDLRVEVSIVYYDVTGTYPDTCDVERTVTGSESYLTLYIQINDGDPIAFTATSSPLIFDNISTIYTYEDSLTLKKGDQIRIYGDMIGNISDLGDAGATLWIHSKNGVGEIYIPQSVIDVTGEVCTFLPAEDPTDVTIVAPSLEEIPTYFRITADTVYPETEVVGYWLHDVFAGILARIGADPLYSEILGATYTKTRQYDADGCFANFFLAKGVHIRGYNLTEEEDSPIERYTLQQKPFSMSFKECWDGANPIFNLGLSYEVRDESPEGSFIRIEDKAHFFDTSATSVNFSDVYDITRAYDKDAIFKKVIVGYDKWESESYAGIDDPQTKHTYATRFSGVGKDINLVSKFIAASLAIENTRRMTVEKSADYKFDNDTFIIAVNVDNPDPSPPVFEPELDENFESITNLKHSETRYNLILTPLRNFLRWGDYLSGCLQTYLTSAFKFVSGEGNFDMQSEHSCGSKECQAIICDELTESQDISMGDYSDELGFLHLPLLYEIRIPMEWEEYKAIRNSPKKPIGISQTSSGFTQFFIKDLSYNLFDGEATVLAWPREYFEIQQIDQVPEMGCVQPDPVAYDADYQAVLDYADGQGWTTPSDAEKLIQSNKLASMKSEGVWDDLDLFYYFEGDGSEDFKRINWKSPGDFILTKHNTVGFNSDGVQGNGVNGYLDTGWAPNPDAVHFTQDEGGVFLKINNDPNSGSKTAFGCRGNASNAINGQLLMYPKLNVSSADRHSYAVNGQGTNTGSGVSAQGFFHIQRTASNAVKLFKDGSQVGSTDAIASTTLSTRDLVILATNYFTGLSTYSDARVGCFGIGASLTGKESALNTIFNS